jgi:hypothetical protein
LADSQNIPGSGGTETLKIFNLLTDTKSKSDWAWGKNIAQYICSTVFAGIGSGYFWIRNSRFKANRDLAAGKVDPVKWQDRLDFNGKVNYINLNWAAIKVVSTTISKIVGRWMGRNEKIVVRATDSLSEKDRIEGYQQAEFYMMHRDMVAQLEQASGTQITPKDQFIPEDPDELLLWSNELQRLPEEILYEKGVNDILDANGFFDQNKEKLLHDSAEVGLPVTHTEMDTNGVIDVSWIKSENFFYSWSEYNDLHDCSWQGDAIGMKITEIRGKFGVEFGGHLTEEQLWEIAQSSQEYQLYDKLRWLVEWNVAVLRPYDEWNVPVVRFYVKTLDKDPYTLVQTKKNKSTFLKKGGTPAKLAENEEYVEDKNIKIYKGLYIRSTETILSWGLWENMIRPQDPKEYGECLFPYAPYMYQNQDMKNVAIPEKVEEPADQMILARYKIQQCVMSMIPHGAAVNTDAIQELDYGLGDKNRLIDPVKFYQQTGMLYYRGKDGEGNPIPVPIEELANSGFMSQMQGLIQTYEFHYKVYKDELGEDPSISTQAAKPRVTSDNVQSAMQAADEATDYMYDAYLYCMEGTAKRISCLLHDSVTYGADAYRKILKEDNIKGRAFSTIARMLPTDTQMQALDMFMQQALQANPELITFLDPFKLRRLAMDDVKLAELYMRRCQKKMWQAQQQAAQQQSQQNAQAQQQSLQMKAQLDMEHEQAKAQFEAQKNADLSRAKKEELFIQMISSVVTAGVPMPPALQQVADELYQNVGLPLFAANQKNQQALQQGVQQGMQMAAGQPGAPPQPGGLQQPSDQQDQGQPQGQPDQSQPQDQSLQTQPQ